MALRYLASLSSGRYGTLISSVTAASQPHVLAAATPDMNLPESGNIQHWIV